MSDFDALQGLKNLQADFAEKKSKRGLTKIDWAEAGGAIYVPTACSAFERQPCIKAAAENKMDEFHAWIVIQFARNKEGRKIFQSTHLNKLTREVDGAVLQDIADKIADAVNFNNEDIDDSYEIEIAEKNSKAIADYTQGSLSRNDSE